jgi:predicted Fe-Mo cluster-binding NifX family protein
LTETASIEHYTRPASEEQLQRIAELLRVENIEVVIVDNGADAKQHVLDAIPLGADVLTAKSKTIEDISLFAEIHESGRYRAIRSEMMKMDRQKQRREITKLGATPDYEIGSVQAVTEDGALVAASYSASQIGPYANGAGRLFLVIGSQKIVPDLDAALRRIGEHVFPYEDARLREQLGVGTKAAKILISRAEPVPGRVTVIFVREPVGV